jgi:hypothetical protein
VVTLVGEGSNRQGVGARIWASFEGTTSYRRVRAGSSYLSQKDPRVHIGLADAKSVDIEVQWPSGIVDHVDGVGPNRSITIHEGQGLVSSIPLRLERQSTPPTAVR